MPLANEMAVLADEMLHLNGTIYGLKQLAVTFWKELQEAIWALNKSQWTHAYL
jgi:hypothetical protein